MESVLESAALSQPRGVQSQAEVFKRAMRRLTSTISIVTTKHRGRRHGMVATAICSVGVSPPSILVSVAMSASIHDPLIDCGNYCVNLLASSHRSLVKPFSGALHGEERFSQGEWGAGPFDLPYLEGAQASLFCRVSSVVPFASHSIVIGSVAEIGISGEVKPLLYGDGQFAIAQPLT